MKKEFYPIVAVQVVSTILIIVALYIFTNQTPANTPDDTKAQASVTADSAAINSMSSRMGQIQMDLFEIKAKLNQR